MGTNPGKDGASVSTIDTDYRSFTVVLFVFVTNGSIKALISCCAVALAQHLACNGVLVASEKNVARVFFHRRREKNIEAPFFNVFRRRRARTFSGV